MTDFISLKTADGATISAFVAKPAGTPRGAVVVCQEIFGINNHIRNVTSRYAAEGYLAIAPALFDRVEKNVELAYDQAGMQAGIALMKQSGIDTALADITAAAAHVKNAGKIAIVGFCWGGTLAWAAACRTDLFAASVAYYGGGIGNMLEEKPRCPVIAHFGNQDQSIPMETVEKFKAAQPDVPVHVYDAGHGFNCDERASYNAAAAELARSRTLAFLKDKIG